MYNFTLSLTLAQDGVVVNVTIRPLYPLERPGNHRKKVWVGPRAGMDGCGKSQDDRDSIPEPSIP